MRLPSRKNLFRKYERALFWNESAPEEEKLHAFYNLLRPCLRWLDEKIAVFGLTSEEVDSELYILSAQLYKGFNKEKSSIIPYLERFIPWHLEKLFKRLKKTTLKEEPAGLTIIEQDLPIYESFYWKNILLEDKWVGKSFTRAQKYLISIILTTDENELTHQYLSRVMNTDRRHIGKIISELKEILVREEHNGRR
jgi:hypothetical protein